MKKKLDLGCGNRKREGMVGLDVNPRTDADIIHDLNIFPYPFEDSTFDEIYADNVLEHLENPLKVMEELHRISKPDALIIIKVPYFRSRYAFLDPTHRHFFTVESFTYFQPGHPHHVLFNYSECMFETTKIVFDENLFSGIRHPFHSALKGFCDHYPAWYEHHLSHLFPLDELTFYIRTIKL